MPPGAKKRKALKKKKEQEETIGTSTSNKGFNGHGHGEHGSQDDEGESDGNLSSPGSQGNAERDVSPSPLSGQGGKCEDVTAVGRETDSDVDKPPNPCQESGGSGASVLEIAPAVDSSVSKVVISDDENQGNIRGSAAETSKEMKSVKASQVPECSEEKSLLPSGPPVVRTSWLSCCGLFDVSER
uniref:Uncharacterized protein n=1 Tax=Noccaea caerulescens TaxID=107243 RepID=A0A1J3G7A9_NOCCA